MSVLAHVRALGFLPAPPGRDVRQLQRFIEQRLGQRIDIAGVHPAPQHAHRDEASDRAHHHLTIFNSQVLALQQHEAKITRDIGVLEISVVEAARGQDADTALATPRRVPLGQPRA